MNNISILTKATFIFILNIALGVYAQSQEDCLHEYERQLNLSNSAADHVRMAPEVMKEFYYWGKSSLGLPIYVFQGLVNATVDTPGPLAIIPGVSTLVVPLGMAPFTTLAGLLIPVAGVPSTGFWMAVNWAKVPKSFKRDYVLYSIMSDIVKAKTVSESGKEMRKLLRNSEVKKNYRSKKELFNDLKTAYNKGFFCQSSENGIKLLHRKEIIKQIKKGHLREFLAQSDH